MPKIDFFKTKLKKKAKLRTRTKYNKIYKNYKPTSDCSILKDYNKYYLLIPKTRDTEYIEPKQNIVALDPGVRTFQTFYSPSGECGKLGDNIVKALEEKHKKIDLLKSLITKTTSKITKLHMKKRCTSLITKMKNIVTDFQWKMCSFLVKQYKTIIIPEFQTKQMSMKQKRNINRSTTRNMLTLSHYKFLEKLKYKCIEYQRNLMIVNEAYTSKTCGNCGAIKQDLNGSKVYNCKNCGVRLDRDYNGARNILLKTITENYK